MPTKISMLLIACAMFASAASAEVSLSYGKEDGKLSFMNATLASDVEQLHPEGPQSFRAHNGEFFVADSLAGRIIRLGADGKILAIIPVQEKPEGMIEDFALVLDAAGAVQSILALTSMNQEIVQVGLDGKVLQKLGGLGDSAGKFNQFQMIETGPNGLFAVADVGRQTLTLFAADGKVIREIRWEWSGFCFDPNGNLAYLKWNETEKANHLILETPDGKPVKDIALGLDQHTNPRLWEVSKDGEALVSYTPGDGFKGLLKIALCEASGKPKTVTDFIPPVVLNRFLAPNPKGGYFMVSADYEKAPEGAFTIVDFSLK